MKRVIIESPYSGDVDANVKYARACVRDSLERGEAPIASHLLYPGILDDQIPHERQWGIEAGLAWLPVAELFAFYIDRGWSHGMIEALDCVLVAGKSYEVRKLGDRHDAAGQERPVSEPAELETETGLARVSGL